MPCGRCGYATHVLADCFAKKHINGTVLYNDAPAKTPSRLRFEAGKKAAKTKRIIHKQNREHSIACGTIDIFNRPPPLGSLTKKRVWYYRGYKYIKDKTGEFKLVGEDHRACRPLIDYRL